MRVMERNKTKIAYALYLGKSDVTDSDGNKTGEKTVSYSEPIEMLASVSAAKGTAEIEQFGSDLNYSRKIVTEDMSCQIDEHSLIWINNATSDSHDHVVVGVARSLNFIAYAVKEVSVTK